MHDGLGDQVASRLGHDLHVRVDQVANRLDLHHCKNVRFSVFTKNGICKLKRDLSLQLRIHRCRVFGSVLLAVGLLRHFLGVDTGAQERRLPRIHIVLRLATQVQLLVILFKMERHSFSYLYPLIPLSSSVFFASKMVFKLY